MLPPHKETLENGLTVVVQPMKRTQVVALQAWVGVGSADELPSEAGLAHLHEHMLFKGTARRRVGEIAQEIESAGGEINAWTSFDQTVYHVVLASRFFEVGLDVLADTLQHSAFDPDELAREKEVVLEEIKRGQDHPARVASEDLFALAYSVHPYRHPVIGTPEGVAAHTRDDVLAFYRRWYVPANLVLCVVGDVTPSKAVDRVRRAFLDFPVSPVLTRHGLQEPPQAAPRARVRRAPFEEAYFNFAFHIPAADHPDVPALDLAAAILGQGESSRLVQRVKRRRSLVTDVHAYAYTPRNPGLLVVGGSCAPARTRKALTAVTSELSRVLREEVSEEELAKARGILESQATYDRETTQGMARKLGFYESTLHDLEAEQRYYAAVGRMTKRDLLEVARRYLGPEHLNVVVVQPEKARATLGETDCLELAGALERSRRPAKGRGAAERVVRGELQNGATLLVLRDTRVPLVALRAAWRGGLRLENPRLNGITNFAAELLTQGTAHRSAAEVAQEVDAMAGSIAGYMGRNSFGLRGEFLSRHFDRALDLFGECLVTPKFGAEEVDRQRVVLLDEIRALDDNPSGLAFRAMGRALYPCHPYRMHLLGTAEVVSRLGRRDLERFYRRHYPVSRLVLAIVGDVDPDRARERIGRLLGAGKAPPRAQPEPRPDPPLAGPVLIEALREKRQAHLVLGFRGATLDSPDRYPLEVLSTILSGQGGRLFQQLRDRQSLAYSVSSVSLEGLEPGYFAVYIGTSPEKIGEALLSIQRQLCLIQESRVPATELRRAQRYLVGTHAISLQRLAAQAGLISLDECYGLGYDASSRYPAHIMRVTRDNVLEVARRYLDLKRYALSIVRPADATDFASLDLVAGARRME